MPSNQSFVSDFVTKLQKRKIEGSQAIARFTAELLRSVISQQPNQALALIEAVKGVGAQLVAANSVELAIGNIVRRVLHIIREEEAALLNAALAECRISPSGATEDVDSVWHSPPSLHSLLDRKSESPAHCHSSIDKLLEGKINYDKISSTWKLKHHVLESVNYLIDELDTCHEQIADQAVELIHQNEVILTLGWSRTVKEFLNAAKEKNRRFQVFVAEGAPKYEGHILAKDLTAKGLQTTVITDAAIFAMISRVNMVVVGIHAVMANGGIIGPVGLHMLALAAKKHAVPFVVVAGTHKLCPLYPQNPDVLLNELRSPSELLCHGEFSDCMDFASMGNGSPLLHVVNPAFDYVPPELVSLFVTDIGGHKPSFMYRLIADYYSTEDLVLQNTVLE